MSQRDSPGRDQLVLFASKALTDNELNWHTRDKEAFVFIFALRKFRPNLLGRKFIWYTDNKGLQWLRNTRDPRGRYTSWCERLPERLRPKTPTTPEREEPHTTSQTLQQDGDPSSLTTATPEKPTGLCTGTARRTREETDVKRDEQQLEPANDVTNAESRVNQIKSNFIIHRWLKSTMNITTVVLKFKRFIIYIY